MTSLITDAVISACARGQGCDDPENCDCRAWIRDGLIAVLPIILTKVYERINTDTYQDHGGFCGAIQDVKESFDKMLAELDEESNG